MLQKPTSNSRRPAVPGRLEGHVRRMLEWLDHFAPGAGRRAQDRELRSRVAASGLFDAGYYLALNPDAGCDEAQALDHFVAIGGPDGRAPSQRFDPAAYVERFPEAAGAAGGPLLHYIARTLPGLRYVRRMYDTWDECCEREFLTAIDALSGGTAADQSDIRASIVTPTFNRAGRIGAAIDSVLAQTHGNWELIVVDDGSTDDTEAVVSRYLGDSRIRLLGSEKHGVSRARNRGIDAAGGEYLFYLDSDNAWEPNFLTTMLSFMRAGRLDAAYCGLRAVDDRGRTKHFRGDDFNWSECREQNYVDLNCFGHRRLAVGGARFDPGLSRFVDWDLILRMSASRRMAYAPFLGVRYYDGRKGRRITHTNANRAQTRKIIQTIQAKYATFDAERADALELRPHWRDLLDRDGAQETAVGAAKNARPRSAGGKKRPGGTADGGRVFNIGFSTMWHVRGVSLLTRQLAEALEGDRCQTHIFARWESDKFDNSGAAYHPRVFDAGDDPAPEVIAKWARENAIDLMVFIEAHPNDWKRVDALKAAGVRVACYENLDVMRRSAVERYGRFDLFLFHAFYARDVLQTRFPAVPALMVPWGAEAPERRSRPRRGSGGVRFVHVAGWGGLNTRKNTDLVVRAFDAADASGAELHVYSQNQLDVFGKEIAEICRRNPAIHFVEDTIDDIDSAYAGKDMLVMPSKREGLGMTIPEALVRGIPVLTTDGYMMKQWMIPGRHGVLCPARGEPGAMELPELVVDGQGLSDLISELASDPARVRALARNVAKDRHLWAWGWQGDVLRDELARFIAEPGYRPSEDLVYLPQGILDFERERRQLEALSMTAQV